jgi:hypothetical protein
VSGRARLPPGTCANCVRLQVQLKAAQDERDFATRAHVDLSHRYAASKGAAPRPATVDGGGLTASQRAHPSVVALSRTLDNLVLNRRMSDRTRDDALRRFVEKEQIR